MSNCFLLNGSLRLEPHILSLCPSMKPKAQQKTTTALQKSREFMAKLGTVDLKTFCNMTFYVHLIILL